MRRTIELFYCDCCGKQMEQQQEPSIDTRRYDKEIRIAIWFLPSTRDDLLCTECRKCILTQTLIELDKLTV